MALAQIEPNAKVKECCDDTNLIMRNAYHNALGRVLRKDNDVHTGQSNFRAFHNLADFLGILHHLLGGVKAWHRILEHTATNGILGTRNISVA